MDWNKYSLILASSSPSRRLLFERAGIPFTVKVSGVDEAVKPGLSPEKTVTVLAERKARAVFTGQDEIVVAADSMVSIDHRILGKPLNPTDAQNMLKILSGRTHQIYSGVCILFKNKEERFAKATNVTFYPLTEQEIKHYVNTGEPMGKAGSYGIEGLGVRLVQSIHGDYTNIVGIPMAETLRRIEKIVSQNS